MLVIIILTVALGFITVYAAYKVDIINTNFEDLYFRLIICVIVLSIILGLQIREMSERNKPTIKDYVDGKVEMVINETKENDKVIERDTTFKFKEEKIK